MVAVAVAVAVVLVCCTCVRACVRACACAGYIDNPAQEAAHRVVAPRAHDKVLPCAFVRARPLVRTGGGGARTAAAKGASAVADPLPPSGPRLSLRRLCSRRFAEPASRALPFETQPLLEKEQAAAASGTFEGCLRGRQRVCVTTDSVSLLESWARTRRGGGGGLASWKGLTDMKGTKFWLLRGEREREERERERERGRKEGGREVKKRVGPARARD